MKIFNLIAVAALFAATAAPLKADDYSRYTSGLPFKMEEVKAPQIPDLTVKLTDFGGCGDGITLNTGAFAAAIESLSARGGGHLVVESGVWLTGPIVMKSNIDLHLTRDAIVLFSPDKSLFPIIEADEGTSGTMRTPPIFAWHESNFSITGSGIFDGNGEVWRPVKRFKVSDAEWKKMQRLGLREVTEGKSKVWYPTEGNPTDKVETKRARLIRIVGCSNFMVEGVVIQNSPSFHLNVVLSHDFIIDGVMVRCPWNAQNGDGIDLSSCRNALIVNSSVDAGDDAICLKSGIGDTGRRRGPCENIVVEGCTVFHGHGGFVIGSDTSGGMNNIMVRDCRFIDTDTGLRFKSGRDRGGDIRNVTVENIVMCDIAGDAILFDCYYDQKASEAPAAEVTANTPTFRDFTIRNIVCRDAARPIVMLGLPEKPIENISITGCTISSRGGALISNTRNVTINCRLDFPPATEPVTVSGCENLDFQLKN